LCKIKTKAQGERKMAKKAVRKMSIEEIVKRIAETRMYRELVETREKVARDPSNKNSAIEKDRFEIFSVFFMDKVSGYVDKKIDTTKNLSSVLASESKRHRWAMELAKEYLPVYIELFEWYRNQSVEEFLKEAESI
jgi:ribosomal protein L29